MSISFQFKEEESPIFGKIKRPIAEVLFKQIHTDIWQPVTMLVDTGADYTLLPMFFAETLGVNFKKDCRTIKTQGVGRISTVYLLERPMQIQIGSMKRFISLGFLNNNYIPPLLGRHKFFETFKVVFDRHIVTFDS